MYRYLHIADGKRAPCIHDVPYARMIRLTDKDGPRVNDPIQETRALRFPSFSPSSLPFSLIVVPPPSASDCASHESPPTPRRISLLHLACYLASTKIGGLIDDTRLAITRYLACDVITMYDFSEQTLTLSCPPFNISL